MANSNDLIRLDSFEKKDIETILQRALELDVFWAKRKMPQTLAGKSIGLITEDTGWRNPSAIQIGVQSMGAVFAEIPASLSGKESLADLAAYLDNWFDLIVVRTPEIKKIDELASFLNAPVMNIRTYHNHPCETLGDLSYILKKRGSLADLKVCAVSPKGNILQSWIEASLVLPIELTQIAPEDYLVDGSLYDHVHLSQNIESIRDADVIITDCWPKGCDQEQFSALTITKDILDATKKGCLFIPCPPVTRGQELTQEAAMHSKHKAYETKAFLLHAQNAFIEYALN